MMIELEVEIRAGSSEYPDGLLCDSHSGLTEGHQFPLSSFPGFTLCSTHTS